MFSLMIMINNGKKYATTGLEKPHGQNRDLGYIWRWGLQFGGVQLRSGGGATDIVCLRRVGSNFVVNL